MGSELQGRSSGTGLVGSISDHPIVAGAWPAKPRRPHHPEACQAWLDPASIETSGFDGIHLAAAAIGAFLFSRSALRAQHSRQVKALEQRITHLSTMAEIDPLTGLWNRRCFNRRLDAEWRRAIRQGSHITLAIIDVDAFKFYNDSYGHPAGDGALRVVARCLGETLGRAADAAFRIGGEEFALILPDTDRSGAEMIGGRLCEALRSAAVPHAKGPSGGVLTLSFGSCSAIPRVGNGADTALAIADNALYEAKAMGRDRAVCAVHRPRSAARPERAPLARDVFVAEKLSDMVDSD